MAANRWICWIFDILLNRKCSESTIIMKSHEKALGLLLFLVFLIRDKVMMVIISRDLDI